MLSARIIPCLLISNGALVKGTRFSNHRYLGDPLNAVRIFNQKEATEIILIDISARQKGVSIDPGYIESIAKQCSMPLTVGGGIDNLTQASNLISAGAEKIVLGTAALKNSTLIKEVSTELGSQSVVVSIDVQRGSNGVFEVLVNNASVRIECNLREVLEEVVSLGAGEILLNSIDRDGSMQGYDIELLKDVTSLVNVPVIALGGAGSYQHLAESINLGGASAAAAGSLFVFHGARKAVLINYPDKKEVKEIFERSHTKATL